ncbi:MAG: hypothetical protein WC455_13455 [Dehalococcoidia bacterium]|jgi:hypothetical protein
MKQAKKLLGFCFLAFFVGMGLHSLHVLAPVHEMGHVVFSLLTGNPARIASWTSTELVNASPFSIVGGHYFSLIVYTAIACLWFAKHPYVASFAWGACHSNMVAALRSQDFNVELAGYLNNGQIEVVAIFWIAINVVVLMLGWIVVILQFSRRAELIASNSRHQCPTSIKPTSQKAVLAFRR